LRLFPPFFSSCALTENFFLILGGNPAPSSLGSFNLSWLQLHPENDVPFPSLSDVPCPYFFFLQFSPWIFLLSFSADKFFQQMISSGAAIRFPSIYPIFVPAVLVFNLRPLDCLLPVARWRCAAAFRFHNFFPHPQSRPSQVFI